MKRTALKRKLIILGELTDLNTYINKERANKFIAAKIKKDHTEEIYWECKVQHISPVEGKLMMTIDWYCKDRKKDPDNIAFAKKFILDGLKEAGIIKNDGWNNIMAFKDNFFLDEKNPRIEVEIIP